MTRINAAIEPSILTNKHLLAEHREIKRIPNSVKNLLQRGTLNLNDQPNDFKLGKGHVKFFYNKLKYLHNRYNKIYEECLKRGFKISNYNESFEDIPSYLYNDWKESYSTKYILQERLLEKDSYYKKFFLHL